MRTVEITSLALWTPKKGRAGEQIKKTDGKSPVLRNIVSLGKLRSVKQ